METNHNTMNSIEWLKEAIANWWLWLFGGIATQFYWISQWKKFTTSLFLINIFIAFFMGYIMWQFIWLDVPFRDWFLTISGCVSLPLMALIEKKWAWLLYKFIGK